MPLPSPLSTSRTFINRYEENTVVNCGVKIITIVILVYDCNFEAWRKSYKYETSLLSSFKASFFRPSCIHESPKKFF